MTDTDVDPVTLDELKVVMQARKVARGADLTLWVCTDTDDVVLWHDRSPGAARLRFQAELGESTEAADRQLLSVSEKGVTERAWPRHDTPAERALRLEETVRDSGHDIDDVIDWAGFHWLHAKPALQTDSVTGDSVVMAQLSDIPPPGRKVGLLVPSARDWTLYLPARYQLMVDEPDVCRRLAACVQMVTGVEADPAEVQAAIGGGVIHPPMHGAAVRLAILVAETLGHIKD